MDLSASVNGSTGPLSYTFYCDRTDAGTDIMPGWNAQYSNVNLTSKVAADVCDYEEPSTYTAKVIVENGSDAAEARLPIRVTSATLNVPYISATSVSSISQLGAALNVSVNPKGSSTIIWFDWGNTPAFGNMTAPQLVGAGTSITSASVTLGGLQCGTTYYFRAKAQNGGGTSSGSTLTFATASCGGGTSNQTQELVSNGGFEQGLQSWWSVIGSWYADPRYTTTPHSG